MSKKSTLALITIILIFSLIGCGTSNQMRPSFEAAKSQESPTGTITEAVPTDYEMLPYISGSIADLNLDANADGTTQQLKVGQVTSVSLESNPSTGYSWFATSSDPAVIVQMGEPEFRETTTSTTPVIGAPGTAIFFFQAVKTGNATINLEYKRGWEKDVAAEKTITITLEVK